MAQLAVTKKYRTILAESLSGTSIEMEKRNQQLFLCNIAKDDISLQKLLRDPTPVRKPQEPEHELQKDGETQTQARDRGVRNQEKRVQWEKHWRDNLKT